MDKIRRMAMIIMIIPVVLKENVIISRVTTYKNLKALRLILNVFLFVLFQLLYNSRNRAFKLIDQLYSLIKTALAFIFNE